MTSEVTHRQVTHVQTHAQSQRCTAALRRHVSTHFWNTVEGKGLEPSSTPHGPLRSGSPCGPPPQAHAQRPHPALHPQAAVGSRQGLAAVRGAARGRGQAPQRPGGCGMYSVKRHGFTRLSPDLPAPHLYPHRTASCSSTAAPPPPRPATCGRLALRWLGLVLGPGALGWQVGVVGQTGAGSRQAEPSPEPCLGPEGGGGGGSESEGWTMTGHSSRCLSSTRGSGRRRG